MLNGKAIALDLGTRKTGVAISDPSRRVVFLREPITHKNESEHLTKIQILLNQENPSTLVLGLSLFKGQETQQSEYSRALKEKIQAFYSGEIVWIDESFTSLEAEEDVNDTWSDSQAARLILEKHLSHQTK